jgi:trimethylamine--corrinoid protein Co-methyltransferase
MLGVQALYLDVLNAAVGKRLGLPTQAYMALSDAKVLDAQAGAETFGSALLAAQAGINSVSGPGMLDFVLVFSLPKLVFDDELCGQALRLVRELNVADDLPAGHLVQAQLAEMHLITAGHTLANWEKELYLPGPTFDRKNRESWERTGEKSLWQRAVDEVERRLAAYQPIDTDPRADAEMRRLIRSGMEGNAPLPEVPPARAAQPGVEPGRRRTRMRNR